MLILDKKLEQRLFENGKLENTEKDHAPMLRISIPGTKCHWLLSELDAEAPNIAFGLCDLGLGFPEMGYVDLNEIFDLVQSGAVLPIITIKEIEHAYPLTVYWRASLINNEVTFDENLLKQAFEAKNNSTS